jgi:alpha/beta superfamily hydrolase
MGDTSERGSRRRWAIGGVIGLAVVAVFIYGAASFFVYDQVGRAPRACWDDAKNNTPTAFKVDKKWDPGLATAYPLPAPQDVTFASRDPQIPDAKLAAWWIPSDGADAADAPAVVIVHGVQSCRREASVLIAAGMLHQAGYSVFLMDLRDHGDSQGDDARFAGGSEEYLDVLGGWDWIKAQGVPAERIGLMGFSFGAINSLVAGGQEPAGDDLTRFDPLTEVTRYDGRHLAFIHGAADAVLPSSMALDLRAAAAGAGAVTGDAWLVPNAGHTDGIYLDTAGYRDRLVAFFDGALAQP